MESQNATAVETNTAPPSFGHRSQAVAVAGYLFTGGQVGAPLTSGAPGDYRQPQGSLVEQTEICLRHHDAITKAAGSTRARVVEVAAFVAEPNGEAVVASTVREFLGADPPLFTYAEVADVALHGLIEVDWIALLDDSITRADGARILEPFGDEAADDEVIPSGPFLITNRVYGDGSDLGEATQDALDQAATRLLTANSSLDRVLKMAVYISDFDSYPQFNEVTQQSFTAQPLPTRSVVVAPEMTRGSRVRVDLIAQATG